MPGGKIEDWKKHDAVKGQQAYIKRLRKDGGERTSKEGGKYREGAA